VQTGLATQVFASPVETREPGFVVFGAVLAKGESLDRVREAMIEAIEGGLARQPTTASELERAVTEARTSYERALADPESFAVMLSEYIALGDWRLFFHARDQLDQMTAERVDAAAARYLVRDNRVVGSLHPRRFAAARRAAQGTDGCRAAGQLSARDARRRRRGFRPGATKTSTGGRGCAALAICRSRCCRRRTAARPSTSP
jgi:hypothetical protein